ncbi:MAG: AtpZ/AtpI family protein [Acidobacteria bacterium]|nr:AtpZ/AtpI family protein [Acidobacteriota bacterium]
MKRKRWWLRQATTWADLSIVGIQFPVAIALGYFWGRWLDGIFGTKPYLTGTFALFGVIAGFINLFRITARAAREEERLAREKQETDAHDERSDGD